MSKCPKNLNYEIFIDQQSVVCTAANTQYILMLPPEVLGITIQMRDPLHHGIFSFKAGQVTLATGRFSTIHPNGTFWEEDLYNKTEFPLYVASPDAGAVVEVILRVRGGRV